jgi:transmembrane sensor
VGKSSKLKEDNKYIQLLGKYLQGDCSDLEKKSVENWLEESPYNQVVFDNYKQLWNNSDINNIDHIFDVDQGWDELNKRIRVLEFISAEEPNQYQRSSKRFIYTLSRIAAIIVVAFGLFYLFKSLNSHQASENVQLTASEIYDQPLVLADGSEILLNKGAKIEYPESFASDKRMINFEGEAYFEVAHNPDKPFIISTGEVRVEVLGTSFNLCACPNGDETVLYLNSGKVRFSSINPEDGTVREQLILTPGQKGIYNRKSGMITRSKFDNQNYLAWKTGILEFNKTPLDEVMNTIEETFGVKVVSEKSFESLSLTARFDHETPESIFESLHTIFGFKYDYNGRTCLIN